MINASFAWLWYSLLLPLALMLLAILLSWLEPSDDHNFSQ
ncbi:hypothetical protein SAMN04488051_11820 [Alkalimonas amylolytica]|uniref:Uncharacterized protein n=1 Tax=Alkalimonas amylolytica TaxID=152573 RepID=A0A1H4G4X0_ALKAM|nr:hypothetical protein SAMN04488051_11820 [Alkalimonas amylolytica]